MRPPLAVLGIVPALVAALLASAAANPPPPAPLVPDPALTPGFVDPAATLAVICVRGYTSRPGVRHVTEATKRRVFAEYHIDSSSQHFEVDHLISLELGGSNDIRNLWSESYDTTPLNAHTKDRLEDVLHALVCSGKVPLAVAQHDIAADWIGAYRTYVGPLPR